MKRSCCKLRKLLYVIACENVSLLKVRKLEKMGDLIYEYSAERLEFVKVEESTIRDVKAKAKEGVRLSENGDNWTG